MDSWTEAFVANEVKIIDSGRFARLPRQPRLDNMVGVAFMN
jgi:hypothetical protein